MRTDPKIQLDVAKWSKSRDSLFSTVPNLSFSFLAYQISSWANSIEAQLQKPAASTILESAILASHSADSKHVKNLEGACGRTANLSAAGSCDEVQHLCATIDR
jgi:hypothetical protein